MAKPIRFPRQHTLSFSVEHSDRLQKEAEDNQMSLSEVARVLFDTGFAEVDRLAGVVETIDPDGS